MERIFVPICYAFPRSSIGFFTENRREHYVESLREKQYMHSMIADLVEDTTKINESIQRNNNRIMGLDSLIEELNKPVYNTKLLYYYRRKYTSAFDEAIFSQRTLSQLKNSGNMRLIHSQEVSDRINDYDLSVNNIDKRANLSQQYLNYSRDLDWSIFDSYHTFKLKINTIKGSDIILQTPGEMKLLSDNASLIKKYSNILISWQGLIESYVFMIGVKKERAISLIAFLKKEYDFN